MDSRSQGSLTMPTRTGWRKALRLLVLAVLPASDCARGHTIARGATARPPPPQLHWQAPNVSEVPRPGWLGLFSSPSGGMGAKTAAGESVAQTFRFGTAAVSRGSHSGTLASYCSAQAQDVNALWGVTGLEHGQVSNPSVPVAVLAPVGHRRGSTDPAATCTSSKAVAEMPLPPHNAPGRARCSGPG